MHGTPKRRRPGLLLALLVGSAAPALAAEADTAPPPEPPPRRGFVHVNVALNLYTWLAPTASAPAAELTPATRAMLFQQVGVGLQVHPLLRLQLTAMFGETLTGLPAGTSAFTLVALMPLAVFTFKGAFVGAGPLIAPRAFGTWGYHLGLFTFFGWGLPLDHGFGVAFAVQVPVMFVQRVSVAATPAVMVTWRF